jgi:DNA invertase Pin-like site-specific DNA recombinase
MAYKKIEKSAVRRAAVYCRVSTELEIQEGSFELQKAYYTEKIANDPTLELVGVYGDYGKSGTSTYKRPEFCRMMKDCVEGRIDVIYTKSISRFSRNLADCVEAVRILKKHGVAVIFEKENLNTMDGSSELLLSILTTIAQEESNSISQNMRWTLQKMHEKGTPTGKVSYGYRRVMPENIWVIDEAEARRVRVAFDSAAEGQSYMSVLDRLNELEEAEGSDFRWMRQERLHYLLKNVSYIGDVLTDRSYSNGPGHRYLKRNRGERDQFYIEEHHEPIVNKNVFDRVQLLIGRGLLNSQRRHYTEEERAILADTSWKQKTN